MTSPMEGEHPGEAVAVQLTRMEGVINQVLDRVGDLRTTVARHDIDINALKADTRQIINDATARELTAVATAKALRDADVARGERWSPLARFSAIIAAFTTAVAALIATYGIFVNH